MKVHQSTDCFCSGVVNYAAVWEVKDMRVRVTVVSCLEQQYFERLYDLNLIINQVQCN